MNKLTKKNGGFTLIELLVVISIIAFLSSVILPAVNKARLKAQATATVSQIQQFLKAINYYGLDLNHNGSVPAPSTAFACLGSTSNNKCGFADLYSTNNTLNNALLNYISTSAKVNDVRVLAGGGSSYHGAVYHCYFSDVNCLSAVIFWYFPTRNNCGFVSAPQYTQVNTDSGYDVIYEQDDNGNYRYYDSGNDYTYCCLNVGSLPPTGTVDPYCQNPS